MIVKSGSLRKSAGVTFAVILSVFIFGVQSVRAELSEEERQARFMKQHGMKAQPVTTSFATNHSSPAAQGKATTATEIVASQNVEPMLSVNGPSAMAAAESRYAQIVSSGGWPTVPKGSYKQGSTNKGIVALNQRLFLEGYLRQEATQGEFASIFTSATKDAVMRFQRNNGLVPSGQVDGATLQALNVSAAERLSTLRANIPRLAEYSQNLGNRYVVVNVPAQQIETVDGNHVFSRHNAIVGRPERPTPVVMTALSNVAFNPYWNAPPSIIERDIVPKIMNGNTSILRDMNIHVFQGVGGPEVDPSHIDWRTAVVDNYHFRQEPGGENAMATAKINFNSPFGIYLHDTPERQLFATGGRFYSSGCVRVDKIAILINWILNGQNGFNAEKIASLAESLERLDEVIVNPPQLRVAYLTAWPTTGGTVAFRRDVYNLDGTGFVVGQPLPVGESSADGQRFVLQPIPRQVAALDAAEADSFSLFGRRIGKKPTMAMLNPAKPAAAISSAVTRIAAKANPAAFKRKFPGLFDWANYHPETVKPKTPVKKLATTSTRPKVLAVAKPVKSVDKKLAVATAKAKSPVPVADANIAKPKLVVAKVKLASTTAKKPDTKCKLGSDGKPVKDCKVEASAQTIAPAKKITVKPEKTVSATN